MSEWLSDRKEDFYYWAENSNVSAKIGAVLVLTALVALLIFLPLVFVGIAVVFLICWLLFSLLMSLS